MLLLLSNYSLIRNMLFYKKYYVSIAIVVDDDRDVNLVLSAILKLKNLMYIRSIVQSNAWIS